MSYKHSPSEDYCVAIHLSMFNQSSYHLSVGLQVLNNLSSSFVRQPSYYICKIVVDTCHQYSNDPKLGFHRPLEPSLHSDNQDLIIIRLQIARKKVLKKV